MENFTRFLRYFWDDYKVDGKFIKDIEKLGFNVSTTQFIDSIEITGKNNFYKKYAINTKNANLQYESKSDIYDYLKLVKKLQENNKDINTDKEVIDE